MLAVYLPVVLLESWCQVVFKNGWIFSVGCQVPEIRVKNLEIGITLILSHPLDSSRISYSPFTFQIRCIIIAWISWNAAQWTDSSWNILPKTNWAGILTYSENRQIEVLHQISHLDYMGSALVKKASWLHLGPPKINDPCFMRWKYSTTVCCIFYHRILGGAQRFYSSS